MTITEGDSVTFEYVGRLPDGTIFDTSRDTVAEEEGLAEQQPQREYTPLTVEVGSGEIIPGLDEGLLGMAVGDEASIEIPPEDAYGEPREAQVHEVDADEFAEMLQGQTPEEGMQIQSQEGAVGTIVHAGDDLVKIDFNHELAGETLIFDVEIVDVN